MIDIESLNSMSQEELMELVKKIHQEKIDLTDDFVNLIVAIYPILKATKGVTAAMAMAKLSKVLLTGKDMLTNVGRDTSVILDKHEDLIELARVRFEEKEKQF